MLAALSSLSLLAAQAQPLMRAVLAAAAVHAACHAPAAASAAQCFHQTQQARSCMTHHKLWTAVDMAGADPAVRAPCSAVTMARSQLPVVRSEDSKASCGELPHSPYRSIFGGLWQHGEPHNIVFSDEHGSVTNEVEKLLLVADELGGSEGVFKVVESFGEGPEWSAMNVSTALRCLARGAAHMSSAAIQREILHHPIFERLVDGANRKAISMTDTELGEVARACAALRCSGSALAQRVC
ncbi:expressed protein [Chlorella variabilis]|uniref:Expressed protein n=1 Tax=Chlorella variabilis TaxID=554065 RepID=E1ZN54_CHLVA|nr:expressed protein [Chlorella variabilis]EFN52910.1 expressed protein [Chlorella variabilis]|eukprot:XP_005845012.1 expressed protein [Chlorella variabilis]